MKRILIVVILVVVVVALGLVLLSMGNDWFQQDKVEQPTDYNFTDEEWKTILKRGGSSG